MYEQLELEEVTKKFNESESTVSARDSDISEVIANNKPVAREFTRKRKKAADTEKDPTILDISDKEITCNNETVKADRLHEETRAIGGKYKRPKTSIKTTSDNLRTTVCDIQHETELKLVPEDDHASNDASAKMENYEAMEHTESIFIENHTISLVPGISHMVPENTDLFEEEDDKYVKEKKIMVKAATEKDRLDETQKLCITDVIGSTESTDNGEEGAHPVGSGKTEDALVDSVFEDEDQKVSMSEDSLECAQELNLAITFVQQPTSNSNCSSSVKDSLSLRPSLPSVLPECSLLVPLVAKPENSVSELAAVSLSRENKIPEIMPSEFRVVEISKTNKPDEVSTELHIPSIPENMEPVMTAAVLLKMASEEEETAAVSSLSQSSVICNENGSPSDDPKIPPSNSKSVLSISSARNEGLLPFSCEFPQNSSSTDPAAASSTNSTEPAGDFQEVVFKASSSSGVSSLDSPSVVSTVASSICSYVSGNSSAAVSTLISSTVSSGALPEDMSMALCTVAYSSIRESPKVIPAACSSFISWEPVSSVTDKVGTIAAVASFSPDRSHPELLGDQAETKAPILTELPPTAAVSPDHRLLKKAPWNASADSVKSTSTAGVSPSRIYLKVHVKTSSVDVNDSDMPTNYKIPQAMDSPVKSGLNFKSASDNALEELCSSPMCPSPMDIADSPGHHLMDPLIASVPELDPFKM